ncbi:MAG: TonB-dependent receptor plug domain-containing protein, partial [Bacteroidia bacterium]
LQVIDKQQIAQMPVQSVTELLSYVAGIDLRQRGVGGVQADLSVLGGTFEQCLVLVNGIKIVDPQTGHHTLNLPIDISQIERIEILKGPAARIFGANALTGAINIITQKIDKSGVYVNSVLGSNFQTDSATQKTYSLMQNRIRLQWAGKEHGHSVQVTYNQSNGYRYNTASKQLMTTYLGEAGNDKLGRFQWIATWLNNDFGANAFYAAPFDNESEEQVKTGLMALNYQKQIRNWKIMTRAYWRNNEDDYVFTRKNPSLYHNFHVTNVIGGELHSSYTMKKGILGLGAETRSEQIHSTNLKDHQRMNTGFFAEYRAFLPKNIVLNMGAYAHYNSDFGFAVYPGLDIFVPMGEKWRAFGNVGTANRLPSYTDLYYVGPGNIGNSNLKPERAFVAEGGVKYVHNSFTFQASGFNRWVTDFIDWVKPQSTAPWQPQNFQQIYTRGLETNGLFRNKQAAQKAFALEQAQVGYTFLLADLGESSSLSKYALDNLTHQVVVNVTGKLFSHLYPTLAVRTFQRLNNEVYTLVDARLAYRSRYVDVFADATNLLNTEYKEMGLIPAPKLWTRLGLTLRWEK